MALHTLWFIVIAVLWCGFFVLEGFDFGVGMLHGIVGRNDLERRVAVNTIGPFWDGNEVWLIVAGAGMFAAFPAWYATMFSALYLALVVLLVALFARGLSFEFRGKLPSTAWQGTWRWGMTVGSAVIPLLVGVALGDLLHGLPIDKSHEFTGNFLDLLTGYGLWTGVTLVVLSLVSGAAFLVMKTNGAIQQRSASAARAASVAGVVVVVGFVVWSRVQSGGLLPDPLAVVAVIAAVATAWLVRTDSHGWAFAAAVVTIACTVATIFVDLYSNVMVSSTNKAYNLTVSNASAGSYSLKVMTVVAVVFLPIVLAYQGWTYWVFRRRVRPSAPATETSTDTTHPPASSGS